MNSDKKTANAIGGKTARACDSCLTKRARWYCAADDAFLCQNCDSSVHSANPLARRHERVRLKTASFKPIQDDNNDSNNNLVPSWHQGFTRKARTPRHAKPQPPKSEVEPISTNLLPLVPEIGTDEASPQHENEAQLLYRVPIFDPFIADFCTNDATTPTTVADTTLVGNEESPKVVLPGNIDNLTGYLLPSDMELAEFAADVESLLGRGLDDDSFGMEGLGLLTSKEEEEENNTDFCFANRRVVKVEQEENEVEAVVAEMDMSRETLDLNFDYDSPTTVEEENEQKMMGSLCKMEEISRNISLRLDYEAVITAWASQGSPWMAGDRPQFNPDDCWPDFTGTYPMEVQQPYGDIGGIGGHGIVGDGGREARVSRYREKRRTRLFSKKIRYEVRKLNAEKRPRMKGRFVKRTSFVGPAFPYSHFK